MSVIFCFFSLALGIFNMSRKERERERKRELLDSFVKSVDRQAFFSPFRVERSGSLNTTDAVVCQSRRERDGQEPERKSNDSIDSISHRVGG